MSELPFRCNLSRDYLYDRGKQTPLSFGPRLARLARGRWWRRGLRYNGGWGKTFFAIAGEEPSAGHVIPVGYDNLIVNMSITSAFPRCLKVAKITEHYPAKNARVEFHNLIITTPKAQRYSPISRASLSSWVEIIIRCTSAEGLMRGILPRVAPPIHLIRFLWETIMRKKEKKNFVWS